MTRLFEKLARPLATPQTPGAFLNGLRWMGIDGTVFDIPDLDDFVTLCSTELLFQQLVAAQQTKMSNSSLTPPPEPSNSRNPLPRLLRLGKRPAAIAVGATAIALVAIGYAAGMTKYRDVFCRDQGFVHVCRYVTGLIHPKIV